MSEVRITLTIEAGEEMLKISRTVTPRKAIEIYNELYSGLNIASYKQNCETAVTKKEEQEVNAGQAPKKEEKEGTSKKIKNEKNSLYTEIIKYIEMNGPVSSKELIEALDFKKENVYVYVNRMKKRGEIINPKGIKRLYCSSEKGIFGKFIENEKYQEILNYILFKDKFKMDEIRKRFYMYKDIIPNVIKPLSILELIEWDEGKEEYIVPVTTKIWYCVLKEREAAPYWIAKKLSVEADEAFEKDIKEAIENQLIEQTENGSIKARLK